METPFGKSIPVPLEKLVLDPNNPRLALDEPPGYDDPTALLDPNLQASVGERITTIYDGDELVDAIIGQGWMPIDSILVWEIPGAKGHYIVVEGNRRTVALRTIRSRLKAEENKLRRMKEGRRNFAQHEINAQEQKVDRINRIIADTDKLEVKPIAASTLEELDQKLRRILAVRHITGARRWGSYAEDLWLLDRYEDVFQREYPNDYRKGDLRWIPSIVERVADEASLTKTKAQQKMLAASCFSHFKATFEDKLPDGDELDPDDYYLLELIVRNEWLRDQFGLGTESTRLSEQGEQALFEWTFKILRPPKPRKAENNKNVFYRHENVRDWGRMKHYDDQHGTSFASRFSVSDPGSAPTFREVEAEWLGHQSRTKPTAVIEKLLDQFAKLTTETLMSEGQFLRPMLEKLQTIVRAHLRMIAAVDTEAASLVKKDR